jgi:hypothetical protein
LGGRADTRGSSGKIPARADRHSGLHAGKKIELLQAKRGERLARMNAMQR